MGLPGRVALAAGVAFLLLTAAAAGHPEHGANLEEFPGEGVAAVDQHARTAGALAPVRRNVRLVGRATITNPAGGGIEGRVADVAAYGNYAYLTAFREPTCEAGGAHTIDISNPARPAEVTSAFMPTTPGSYAGEGAQTLRLKTASFDGVLFIHQNETCLGAAEATEPRTRGGINIWDITNPRTPRLLAAHAGDYTGVEGAPKPQASQTHSMFAWVNATDRRAYVGLIDVEETTNVDILDITDPRSPQLVNDTLDLNRPPFSVRQTTPPNLNGSFAHDLTVKRIGRRDVMVVNYWDGGYALLDVTFPRAGGVTLVAQSDFPARDPERRARGQQIAPEGNAHQSELSPDNAYLIGTDEDFQPFRTQGRVTAGPHAGAEYFPTPATGSSRLGAALTGQPTFVGDACGAVARGAGIAIVERSACTFQEKLDAVRAAGYTAALVFNSVRDDCLTGLTMSASGPIPYLFVSRLAGLQLLQVPGVTAANACTTAAPSAGTRASSTTVDTVFDGWGYVRLSRTRIPGAIGSKGSIAQIDSWALPQSQRRDFAGGHGVLSVHEVAVDPRRGQRLAYVSHYAGGFRVLEYGPKGLKEVGAFIEPGGSNFWGVEVHRVAGRQYVLASDRDYGLYIFQYVPRR
jgi:PA domain/LVIVD repeat